MKNTIKKITAIAMCGVLTVGSVLMTGAVSEDENHKDFEVTGTTQKILTWKKKPWKQVRILSCSIT